MSDACIKALESAKRLKSLIKVDDSKIIKHIIKTESQAIETFLRTISKPEKRGKVIIEKIVL